MHGDLTFATKIMNSFFSLVGAKFEYYGICFVDQMGFLKFYSAQNCSISSVKLLCHRRSEFGIFLSSIVTTCPYRLRGPPSWLWPKCYRLLSLGRPKDAVTLPRWCEWWYVWAWSAGRGLKPKSYRLTRPWSLWGSSTARENSHGRNGNRTRDFMFSSQKLWTPSHKAGLILECKYSEKQPV
jgi:hypothetical protein